MSFFLPLAAIQVLSMHMTLDISLIRQELSRFQIQTINHMLARAPRLPPSFLKNLFLPVGAPSPVLYRLAAFQPRWGRVVMRG